MNLFRVVSLLAAAALQTAAPVVGSVVFAPAVAPAAATPAKLTATAGALVCVATGNAVPATGAAIACTAGGAADIAFPVSLPAGSSLTIDRRDAAGNDVTVMLSTPAGGTATSSSGTL